MSHSGQNVRLDSWKAIARHLGCSVRSARRWENEEGLPVHRQLHRAQGRVHAFTDELDRWLSSRSEGPRASPASGEDATGVAVLPFEFLGSRDDGSAWLADGVREQLLADLARVRPLRVTSSLSSRAVAERRTDAKETARLLGVRYLVEGSVQKVGNRVRVFVRLIDPSIDDRLWSETFDTDLDSLFEVQPRIAHTTTSAMQIQLSGSDQARLRRSRIRDPRAWQLAVEARADALRWSADAIDAAVRRLTAATELEPDSPDLHAALGRTWLQYREAGMDTSGRSLEAAEAAAARGLALDPNSAACALLQASLAYFKGDIAAAIRGCRRALDERPDEPDALLLVSNCYLISGRVAAARPYIERLAAVDPLTPLSCVMPGWADLLEGRFEAALEAYRRMFEMDPANPLARLFYLWVLLLNDRRGAALQLVRDAPADDSPVARVIDLYAHALERRGGEWQCPPALQALANTTDVLPRFLAYGYALLEDVPSAAHWLDLACERGFINYPFLAHHDPLLRPMHGDPRMAAVLERVRRRWEHFDA